MELWQFGMGKFITIQCPTRENQAVVSEAVPASPLWAHVLVAQVGCWSPEGLDFGRVWCFGPAHLGDFQRHAAF